MLLRLAPPTLVKEPPTYTVLPETAIDRTSPFAAAVQDVRLTGGDVDRGQPAAHLGLSGPVRDLGEGAPDEEGPPD